MKLTVAGTPKEYDAGLTVEKLLEVKTWKCRFTSPFP